VGSGGAEHQEGYADGSRELCERDRWCGAGAVKATQRVARESQGIRRGNEEVVDVEKGESEMVRESQVQREQHYPHRDNTARLPGDLHGWEGHRYVALRSAVLVQPVLEADRA